MYLWLVFLFHFLGSTSVYSQLSLSLPTTIRLGITLYLNQSRQVLQYQQLTAILDDQNNAIDQAVDRLGITIVLFYLLLFGSLAQLESIL